MIKTYLHVAGLVAVAFLGNACSKKSASAILGADDASYSAPPGDDATLYLASAHDVAPIDSAALSKALSVATADGASGGASLLDDSGAVGEADSATVDLIKSGSRAKASLDVTAFHNPSASTFAAPTSAKTAGLALDASLPIVADPDAYNFASDPAPSDATWGGKDEVMISRLGQIPVRNQEQRGTCAAHAGIATLEYMLLKKYSSKLTTVDLSEQRFYMMSKSDLWSSGGVTDQQAGSAWDLGLAMSLGLKGVTVPSTDAKYNIPLEDDCPYSGAAGANELQLPQALSCERGAVRVASMSQSFYYEQGSGKEWHSTGLLTAQDILGYLVKHDLPVAIAANITENWEKNDGVITYAKDQTSPKVIGGHAFLVVGARKLDQTQYPNEGGMCFIIKNTWGPGWGTNGFACMTLAWFNNFRTKQIFDVPFDIDVDIDYILKKAVKGVPSGVSNGATLATAEDLPVKTVQLASTPANPGLSQVAQADTGAAATTPAAPPAPTPTPGAAPAPAPSPTPQTTTDGFTYASLIDQTGAQFKALYKVDGGKIQVVGVLKDEASVTKVLSLAFDAASGQITYTDAARGDKVVGLLQNGTLNLCGQKYADICLLHIVTADKSLVIGLTEAEFDRYTPDPNANFASLVAFAGYGIDISLASIRFADLRLNIAGTPTNAIRLKVDPLSGAINYGGREVGNYQKVSLCSGAYKDVCRFVVNKDDKTLNILLKTK